MATRINCMISLEAKELLLEFQTREKLTYRDDALDLLLKEYAQARKILYDRLGPGHRGKPLTELMEKFITKCETVKAKEGLK